ncbi:MAG TPA: hypothetical protein VEH48_01640 [Candidatus Nitrosopolaris sp.]|nr:hypothetical protein [Candidatus Nitrosopolaris sp.]
MPETLDNELIEATRRRFRYHRPTVEHVQNDSDNPNDLIYFPYDLKVAASDTLGILPGVELRLVDELAKAAKQGLNNWQDITERRKQRAAEIEHRAAWRLT